MSLIGLDIGTTGCKAVVFDPEGRMLARAFREYGMVCDVPAKAEQDAEQVWALAKETLGEVASTGSARNARALSVSVQGDAIIPVDREFRALHPALLGMDYRSAAQARQCAELFGEFELFQRTGMRPHPLNSLTKVLLLRELAPAVFERAWKIVTYADFMLGKLGGEAVLDHTMASRTMAFDLAGGRWCEEIHRRLGLSPELWSATVPSGQKVGALRPALAEELGLPRRLVLVSGGHDQTCAALGAGAVREGRAVVSTGTAEVLSTALDKPVLSRAFFDGYYPCYRHVVPGRFFTFGLNHSGGVALRWWRDQFGAAEISEAAARGIEAYAVMDERLPTGPSPVLVLPHFTGRGTPSCDLAARGAVLGLTLATSRHDVFKGVLEGLCFELRANLEAWQAAGVRVDELVAVGGGAKSAAWVQLKADVLGRPVRTLRCPEAAALGAALLAGTAVGVYASLEEAVARAVVPDRQFEPMPDRAAHYRERWSVYQQAAAALQSLNPLL